MGPFQDQREISEGNLLHGERNPSVKVFCVLEKGLTIEWTPQVTKTSDPLVLTCFPFPSITRDMSGTTEFHFLNLFLTLFVFSLAFVGNDWPLEYCPWPIGIIFKGLGDGEI